jgi:pimeloyl-ACP methyl ester carboxylesterase
MRSLRRVIAWTGAAAVLAIGALASRGVRSYREVERALHPPRGPVAPPPELAPLVENVAFTTPAGTHVAAWYVPPRNGAIVVTVHGSPGDRRDMTPEALIAVSRGYGVVMPDLPGHGESGGAATWGRDAQDAVSAAIDFAAPFAARVALIGFSFGSCVAARVAARDPRVGAVVLTGALTDARAQLRYQFRGWGPLSQAPAIWAAEREGLAFEELDNTAVVARIAPRPLLLVAGSADAVVPSEMVVALYASAREPRSMVTVHGAGHGQYVQAGGIDYSARLWLFLDESLHVRFPAPDGMP